METYVYTTMRGVSYIQYNEYENRLDQYKCEHNNGIR